MIARDTTQQAIEQAAQAIGVRFGCDGITPVNKCGTGFRFVLRPIMPSKRPAREYGRWFRRGTSTNRTISAVCWHGHREFFRKLFELSPTARVQTRETREHEFKWYTAENFERVYESADRNIGSMFNPVQHSEACWCGQTMLDRVTQRLTQDPKQILVDLSNGERSVWNEYTNQWEKQS